MRRVNTRIGPQLASIEKPGTAVSLDRYQDWTRLTDKNRRSDASGIGFALLGLFGEVGSLLSELKRNNEIAIHILHITIS